MGSISCGLLIVYYSYSSSKPDKEIYEIFRDKDKKISQWKWEEAPDELKTIIDKAIKKERIQYKERSFHLFECDAVQINPNSNKNGSIFRKNDNLNYGSSHMHRVLKEDKNNKWHYWKDSEYLPVKENISNALERNKESKEQVEYEIKQDISTSPGENEINYLAVFCDYMIQFGDGDAGNWARVAVRKVSKKGNT